MAQTQRDEAEEVKIVELDLGLFHLMWVILKIFVASLPAFAGAIIIYGLLIRWVISSIGG
jgi:hypothetical protein